MDVMLDGIHVGGSSIIKWVCGKCWTHIEYGKICECHWKTKQMDLFSEDHYKKI